MKKMKNLVEAIAAVGFLSFTIFSLDLHAQTGVATLIVNHAASLVTDTAAGLPGSCRVDLDIGIGYNPTTVTCAAVGGHTNNYASTMARLFNVTSGLTDCTRQLAVGDVLPVQYRVAAEQYFASGVYASTIAPMTFRKIVHPMQFLFLSALYEKNFPDQYIAGVCPSEDFMRGNLLTEEDKNLRSVFFRMMLMYTKGRYDSTPGVNNCTTPVHKAMLEMKNDSSWIGFWEGAAVNSLIQKAFTHGACKSSNSCFNDLAGNTYGSYQWIKDFMFLTYCQ